MEKEKIILVIAVAGLAYYLYSQTSKQPAPQLDERLGDTTELGFHTI